MIVAFVGRRVADPVDLDRVGARLEGDQGCGVLRVVGQAERTGGAEGGDHLDQVGRGAPIVIGGDDLIGRVVDAQDRVGQVSGDTESIQGRADGAEYALTDNQIIVGEVYRYELEVLAPDGSISLMDMGLVDTLPKLYLPVVFR